MKNSNTEKLVRTGLMAALCCVATFIHIPTFFTLGYVNLGDGFVLSSAFLLGPFWGALAGGIGSMLADLFLGYPAYAPGTFVIKGLMALLCGICFFKLSNKNRKNLPLKILCAVLGEAVMVLGYLVYEAYILKYGMAALGSVYGNIFQGIAGIIFSVLISEFIKKKIKF